MRGLGQSEVSACGNESRPGCAAQWCGPLAYAASLSSHRKGSVNGASRCQLGCVSDIKKGQREATHDEVDVLDIGVGRRFVHKSVEVPFANFGLGCRGRVGLDAAPGGLCTQAWLREIGG